MMTLAETAPHIKIFFGACVVGYIVLVLYMAMLLASWRENKLS